MHVKIIGMGDYDIIETSIHIDFLKEKINKLLLTANKIGIEGKPEFLLFRDSVQVYLNNAPVLKILPVYPHLYGGAGIKKIFNC